jgi:hypothetical protein
MLSNCKKYTKVVVQSTYCHDHTMVFFNGTTATKKCNHEDNNPQNNEQKWSDKKISLKKIRVIGVEILNKPTNCKNSNARYLKYKYKIHNQKHCQHFVSKSYRINSICKIRDILSHTYCK